MQAVNLKKPENVKYKKDRVKPGHVILLIVLIILGLLLFLRCSSASCPPSKQMGKF